MTTQELIELAVLDAMGLLDEAEREEFDAAFASAAPAIQAQVRREQTRLSLSQDLLPDVEPPAGLRALVLEAVRKAMGSPAERRHRRIAGGALALTPARQVSPWWRAASVGFAAAAMVTGVTFLQLRSELNDLTRSLEADRLLSQMQSAVGSELVVSLLTDPQVVRRNFTPMASGGRGEAAIWTNPAWEEGTEGLLAMANLPMSERPFQIVTYVGGAMGREVLTSFEPQAGLQMVRFTHVEVNQPLAIAAWDATSQAYRPIMVINPTGAAGGIAWAGPAWDGFDSM